MSTDVLLITPAPVASVLRPWRTSVGGLRGLGVVPVVAGAVAAAPKIGELLQKVKPIKKIFDAVKGTLSKLGIGGVTQERFLKRFDDVDGIFDTAGYDGKQPEQFYRQFDIGATQIENNKSSGNYYAEFQRLRKYIIARLNIYNPGLGDLYGQYFPDFPMAEGGTSLGQMDGSPIAALREFVKIAPGTFTSPEQVKQALEIVNAANAASQAPPITTTVPGQPGIPASTTPPGAQQPSSTAAWVIGGGALTALITFLK